MHDRKLEDVIETTDIEVRNFTGNLKYGDKFPTAYVNWMLNLSREFPSTKLRTYKDNQGVTYQWRMVENDELMYLMNNKSLMPKE